MESLQQYLANCVSPFHCINESSEMLRQEGFVELPLSASWQITPGGKYYINCYDSMGVAFKVGKKAPARGGVRIAASHTDWPCLYIKASSENTSAACLRMSVESYGGIIFNTWLDRPLSAAGIVILKGETPFSPDKKLINFIDPVFYIPNLPIHINREINQGTAYKEDIDMPAICRTVEQKFNSDNYLLQKVSEKLNVNPGDILSFDLLMYNTDKPEVVGFNQDLLSSPRLDNLTSAYASIYGLINGKRDNGVDVIALFDNEEIGSRTKTGANSGTLEFILEKIYYSLGLSRSELIDSYTNGFLLSCDVAHAVHPNHTGKYDNTQCAFMNYGVALKLNYEQKYATQSASFGTILHLCNENNIPVQTYMNRPGARGGSTLGSYLSSALAMPAADIGVPILAMHSARELMGLEDQDAINSLVQAFFTM